MKKYLLAALGLLLTLHSAADTISLLPGKITGSVHLSSETIQSGSVQANATDGSGSASASFNGESYSLTVPAGKTWTLSFYFYPQTAGGYTQLYVGSPEQVSVGAGETVQHDVSFASARLTADVQVSHGSLVSVNYLQAYRYTNAPDTSFSAYSNTSYLVVLPFNGVTAYGTVAVQNTAGQNATLALPSTSVDVPAAGATVTWTVDAAFAAGTVLGNVSLQGPATPVATYLSLYGPNGSNSSTSLTANGSGNGSYQFDNLAEGSYTAYTTAYFNNYATYVQFYRYPQVSAGVVTQLDYVADLATVNATLQLGGFINAANLSGANLSGQISDYSINAGSSGLNSAGGLTLYVPAGSWAFPNFSLYSYDYTDPAAPRYVSVSRYNYQAANNRLAIAAGDTVSLPPLSVTTTALELTFDVIEPAGAAAETLISNPTLSAYTTAYDTSGNALASLSIYAATWGNAQAQPSVRLIGEPGLYNVQAYGNVEGSNVSFGSFQLELKVPLVTPVGTSVTVQPDAHTTVVFDHVTTEGVTTAAELPVGPQLPAGYTALTDSAGAKVFYSISTTAAFDGSVEVTVNYDPASFPAGSAGDLHLLAYNSATHVWTDITTSVDAANHLATGDSATLALFVLAVTHDPVLGTVNVPAGGLAGAALDFSASFTDADSGDQHTALWSWGDGSSLTPGTVDETTGAITGQHTYANAGTYHGTLGLTDATGNIVTQDFTVTVGGNTPSDTTAPVITVSASVTAEATGPAGATVSFTVSATDETDGAVATNASPVSGSTFALGTTTVTITATDAAGNTATSTFSVTVQDTTAPAITVPSLGTAEANGPGGASVTFAASAIDLVDGHPSLSYSAASGSVFRIGTTAVTVTATDASGNSSTSSFNVTVADTTAPVLTVPANQTAEATSAAGAPVTFAASATDAVGATVAYSKAPGSVFPVGTTTVTVTATDAAGNSTTGSFTVTVKDTTAPIITAPAAITAEATSAAGATVTFAATATDAVGATLSYSKAPGSVFPIGTTTVTVSATDAAGNNAVAKTFTVTVRDTTGPVFTALTTSAPSLWPPNHKLVAITVSATAADVVSGTTVKILSVTSNEPDNGLGDGDTPNDIAITGVMTLNLRAERSGTGTGRTYTITVQATDAAGNKSTKTVAVVVPLNQGK